MASTITAPTYDPVSTATALAEKYVTALDAKIAAQTASTAAAAKALSSLGSAISTYQASLASLTGLGKSVMASGATLSDTTIGSATAKPQAAAGTYSLFVQQIATAGQVSYNNLTNAAAPGGKLTVKLSDESGTGTGTPVTFDVDLSAANADTDKDGKVSVRELAAAINRATGNSGQVSAGVVTIGTDTRLVLTSKNTGVANTISLDTSAVGDSTLQAGLGARTIVTQAQDAIVLLGGKTGTPIRQSSNTFTNIDGVSLTVTRAQAATENPITLTVASDPSGTLKNVQAFLDAYNKLKTTIDGLLAPGGEDGSTAGGFAHDAGVQALRSRLQSILRPGNGSSLASFGIVAARNGTLTVDADRLNRQLTSDPNGLDKLIGSSSSSAPSGVSGALDTYLDQWSNSINGQIKTRTDANTKLQAAIPDLQAKRDDTYNAAYKRYNAQFTDLQQLQARMNQNLSMFDALFGNDKS
jgi:flagellar hook-associated protein 2